MQPRVILCATNFSGGASQAARAAAVLAACRKATLRLVHVADELNSHSRTHEELERFLRPIRQRLHDEAERLRATGAVVEEHLLTGCWAEAAIRKYVQDQPPELVVVSHAGKTAFDRWTLGSVSERIAEAAPVPTLVVRFAQPFEAWATGQRPLRVLTGVNFSGTSDAALRWINTLRQAGPCDVTAAFINWPPEQDRRSGRFGPARWPEDSLPVQSALERTLTEKVREFFGEDQVAILVRSSWERPDAALIDLAEGEQADLLVVGTQQWQGLKRLWRGSVFRRVLRHAPMNVACVPRRTLAQPATPVPLSDTPASNPGHGRLETAERS